MAGHRPRGVWHAFRLLLIIAVVATLLAAAAKLPAAPVVPPAQHGASEAGHGADGDVLPTRAVVEPGTRTGLASPPGTGQQDPSAAEGTSTQQGASQPEPERAPRVCTGAIPFGRAAAAGDALSYIGAPSGAPPEALADLEQILADYLAGLNGTYGVVVIDLTTGARAEVRGDHPFIAASTFKVPLAMYIFSLAERGEADLAEPIQYLPEDWEGGTGILHGAVEGDCYTVAELVNLSLTVSDNIATNMLLRRFGLQNVYAHMLELGGSVTHLPTGRRATTPRDMALYVEAAYRMAAREDGGLYRVLMGLLTQTVFSDRIAAGAPAGVTVAHKIGTLPAMIHDIGVVFLPDRPFAIAIFSSDVDELVAAGRLADITRIVSAYMQGGAALALEAAASAGSDPAPVVPPDGEPGGAGAGSPGTGDGTGSGSGSAPGEAGAGSPGTGDGTGSGSGSAPGDTGAASPGTPGGAAPGSSDTSGGATPGSGDSPGSTSDPRSGAPGQGEPSPGSGAPGQGAPDSGSGDPADPGSTGGGPDSAGPPGGSESDTPEPDRGGGPAGGAGESPADDGSGSGG